MPDCRLLFIKRPINNFLTVTKSSSRGYSVRPRCLVAQCPASQCITLDLRIFYLALQTTLLDESETFLGSKKPLKYLINAGFVEQNG